MGYDAFEESNRVEVYIRRLRKKIGVKSRAARVHPHHAGYRLCLSGARMRWKAASGRCVGREAAPLPHCILIVCLPCPMDP